MTDNEGAAEEHDPEPQDQAQLDRPAKGITQHVARENLQQKDYEDTGEQAGGDEFSRALQPFSQQNRADKEQKTHPDDQPDHVGISQTLGADNADRVLLKRNVNEKRRQQAGGDNQGTAEEFFKTWLHLKYLPR